MRNLLSSTSTMCLKHIPREVKTLLLETFIEYQVISRSFKLPRPTKSLECTPVTFGCGNILSLVCVCVHQDSPNNLKLKHSIRLKVTVIDGYVSHSTVMGIMMSLT
ncbi:hypothetical protein TNIN_57251 [Trichonephila inaurata madagascariensis]|uniref:Uncharacterized protein n=1 Tax=Trichonephila inaurata madagascariensis TaxID=2747483 RepID=A0A8X6X0Q4_9ARAC|nr:hypothetical protein TNIN_57251 [Trichonephila inaurata madagascariensis]